MCMSECGREEDEVPRGWSRKMMASTLEEGVQAAVARSWRALRIGGVARCDLLDLCSQKSKLSSCYGSLLMIEGYLSFLSLSLSLLIQVIV